MKKFFLLICAFMLFSNHDMYLKLDSYFLQPNVKATIKLFNGTFSKSDNAIARNRMLDVSLVGNGERISVDTNQWLEKDNMTLLNFTTSDPGTWVAGVSTLPRKIEMSAADFNEYLEHDGVLDMLDWRKNNNALEQDVVEKYSKHAKTIFQVGDKMTNDWQTPLGYPIEFIPLSNPYDLHPGHALQIKLVWKGEPLADQLVYIHSESESHDHDHDDETGHNHDHEHADESADHQHHSGAQVRTDSSGHLLMNLTSMGKWYLRTIKLAHSEEPGLTHESHWATLTFEVGHGHSHSHSPEAHSHDDSPEQGIPSYVFWIGSLVLIAGLFFWFNRNN